MVGARPKYSREAEATSVLTRLRLLCDSRRWQDARPHSVFVKTTDPCRALSLTSKAKAEYLFALKGRERRNGVDTFQITFTPRDKDDYGWRGDVWVDAVAFQPVIVQIAMSKNLPFAVRALVAPVCQASASPRPMRRNGTASGFQFHMVVSSRLTCCSSTEPLLWRSITASARKRMSPRAFCKVNQLSQLALSVARLGGLAVPRQQNGKRSQPDLHG